MSIGYILYGVISIILIALTFSGASNRDLRLPVSLFNAFYCGFVLLGYLFGAIIYGYSERVGIMILVSYIAFNLGANGFIPKKKLVIPKLDKPARYSIVFNLLMAIIGILLGVIYYLKLGYIPLLSGGSAEERIAAMTGNGVFLQPMRFVPIAALGLLITGKHNYLAVFLLILGLVNLAGTGFRGIVLQNVILTVIVLGFISNKHIGIGHATALLVVMVPLVVIFALIRGDAIDVDHIVYGAIHTLSVSTYILTAVVNNIEEIYFGSTFFFKFTSLMPVQNVEYTQWLAQQLNISFGGGVTPTIVGDFYINFSHLYWVAFIGLGLFLRYIQNLLLQGKGDPQFALLLLVISLGVARSVTGGISNILFQTTLSAFFCFLIYISSRVKVVH